MTIDAKKAAALDAAISQVLQHNFDADSKTCLLTLIKVLDNVIQKPHNDKVRSIRLGNPAFAKKVVEKRGHSILLACGFAVTKSPNGNENENDDFLTLDADQEDTQLIVHTRHVLAQVAVHQLQCPPDTLPTFQPPPPKVELQQSTNAAGFTSTTTNTGFNIYQGKRFDGQSAAVGANLGPPQGWQSQTELQLSKLQQRQAKLQEKLQKAIGGRDWAVYLPGQQQQQSNSSTSASAAAASLPTAMNPNNKEDVQLLAQHIQKQQLARTAAENRGFTTKAMRDLEKLKKASVYSHTQLAIQLPTIHGGGGSVIVVKANFLPQETIQAVLDGLQESVLIDNTNDLLPPFELYITPPRQLLEPNKTLLELGLVPAAKVYVSWKKPLVAPSSDSSSSSSTNVAWFIRPELLQHNNNGPAKPTSIAVIASEEEDNTKKAATTDSSTSSATTGANKRKKTKAEKEANLLARMLGK